MSGVLGATVIGCGRSWMGGGSDGRMSVPSVVGGTHGNHVSSPKQGSFTEWESMQTMGPGTLRAGIICQPLREG